MNKTTSCTTAREYLELVDGKLRVCELVELEITLNEQRINGQTKIELCWDLG